MSATAPTAEDRKKAKEIVDRAVELLVDGIQEATNHLEASEQRIVPNAIQVHIIYIEQRIAATERAVNTASRLLKEEQELPREIDEGMKMIRLLSVEKATAEQEREDRDKLRLAALHAKVASSEAPIVVRKPQLPPMPIPRFAGNHVEYRNFISLFDAAVHNDPTITAAQKLAYLQSFLDDEPRRMISGIIVNDENYELARQTLQLNYGQSAQTIALLYKRLTALPKARNEPYSIRDTFNEVESILQMLQSEGVDVNNEKYLYGILLEKWPWSLIRQIMREEDLQMKAFREALKRDVELQIKLVHKTGYVPPPSAKGGSRKFFDSSSFSNQRHLDAKAQNQSSQYNQSSSGTTTSGGYGSSGAGGTTGGCSSSGGYSESGCGTSNSGAYRKKSGQTQQNQVPLPPVGERILSCTWCKGNHLAEACSEYKTASARLAKLGNRCKCCFRVKEENHACFRKRKCSSCDSWEHNRALCPIKYPDSEQSTTMFTQADPAGTFVTVLTSLRNPQTGVEVAARVLLDNASNRTIISRDMALALGLQAQRINESTTGLGGKKVEPISNEPVTVSVNTEAGEAVQISARITNKVADDVRVADVTQFRKLYPQFNLYYIPPTGVGRPVDMIIGTDKLVRFISLENSKTVDDSCQLMATKFGWLIMVEADGFDQSPQTMTFFTHHRDAVEVMQDLDVLGLQHIADSEAELEQRAIDQFYKTLTYLDDQRYEIHWPWREYPPNLSQNYGLALGRLRSLHKKLATTPELLVEYNRIIEEQLQEGVIEEVPKNQIRKEGIVHYIPHHTVVTPDKSTSVRIVYDASAALGKAKSLNQNILKGKKWLNNVVGSLLRFRRYRNAITADIRRAFHQISIAESERDAVRFLWVKDTAKPPEGENIRTLRFKRVAFGIVASPFLLYATIQHHLKQNPSEYTDTLCQEMYADNLLVSLPANENLRAFYEQTKRVFSTMSMDMVKWKSNNQKLMASIPVTDSIQEDSTFVLGISWNAERDVFSLKKPKIEKLSAQKPTKRIVLKITASVFDPLGWIAPLILQAKLLLRKLWKENHPWDRILTEQDEQEWRTIMADIKQAHTIEQRRMYFTEEISTAQRYEIHLFADASKLALGAVVYLRSVREEKSEVAIVMARTRLAPKAKLSIPRLELYAMTLGCRLLQFVCESLKMEQCKPEIFGWSDSKCVLAWIQSAKMLPTVVERQLKEIRPSLVQQFRYVPSALNPADMASRGATLSEMNDKKWLAPEWLGKSESWPQHIQISEMDIEEESETLFIQGENTESIPAPFNMNIEDYSNLQILLRKTAYRIKAFNFAMQQVYKRKMVPTRNDLDYEAAKSLWIRWDQRRNGSDNPKRVAQMKHLKNFELFKDERGLVRCKTRLPFENAAKAQPTQILLVKRSHLTKLIVIDIHERNLHVGTSQTLATLRKQYWLTHGRREVYSILRKNCLKCERYKTQPYDEPTIAPLPSCRVTRTSQPFQYTGIDIFGPVTVQPNKDRGKELQKRWVLLLTCLTVRAIHLEILQGMDTMDIISALKRFTARRGTPQIIISDNAKQFHLVNGCLQELWRTFTQNEATNKYFAEQNIEWRFIPENAPWMGGVYERLVGVVKSSLKRTYGERILSEREFDTTIVEIEGVVNNRPITYVDRSPETVLLTPNHFLRVQFPAMPIEISESDGSVNTPTGREVVKFWKKAEQFLNHYWNIWSRQYITELRNGTQAKEQKRKPRVGDVVLMVDPTQRRGFWRTAVIEKLLPSQADKQCRSAQIRVASGTRFIRPIRKLAPLELLNEIQTDEEPVEDAAKFARSVRVEGADDSTADFAANQIKDDEIPMVQLQLRAPPTDE